MAALQEFEKRLWHHKHLLRQFEGLLSPQVLNKLEDMGLTAERLYDMEAGEIGAIIRHPAAGSNVRGCLDCLPSLSMEAQLQPITRFFLFVLIDTFADTHSQHQGTIAVLITELRSDSAMEKRPGFWPRSAKTLPCLLAESYQIFTFQSFHILGKHR